jgi:hypothetical protein
MEKIKYTLVLLCLVLLLLIPSSADQIPDKKLLKKDEVWICTQWQWLGPPFEGKVGCISWIKRDCSDRLYKDICKLSG